MRQGAAPSVVERPAARSAGCVQRDPSSKGDPREGVRDEIAEESQASAGEERPRLPRGRASLDPVDRVLAHGLAGCLEQPAASTARAGETEVATQARVQSMGEFFPQLVRRVSWSGDRRTGTARIELGSGSLEGATLLVHVDHGTVHVRLDLPPGANEAEWRSRIEQRLGARGVQLGSLEVG